MSFFLFYRRFRGEKQNAVCRHKSQYSASDNSRNLGNNFFSPKDCHAIHGAADIQCNPVRSGGIGSCSPDPAYGPQKDSSQQEPAPACSSRLYPGFADVHRLLSAATWNLFDHRGQSWFFNRYVCCPGSPLWPVYETKIWN